MPQIKVKDKFQVTIPSAIRKQLGLHVGDLLEAELKDDQIVLKPQVVIDRSVVFKEFQRLLDDVHEQNKDFSDEEVMQDVEAAIKAVRKSNHG